MHAADNTTKETCTQAMKLWLYTSGNRIPGSADKVTFQNDAYGLTSHLPDTSVDSAHTYS